MNSYFIGKLITGILLIGVSGCVNPQSDAAGESERGSAQSKNPHSMHASHDSHFSGQTGNGYVDSVNTNLIEKDTMKSSPLCTAMATIGGTHIHIEYSSPGVKDRVIWGGLVPYDQVWASGAHMVTSVNLSKDIIVEGKTIPKGIYGLFTVPGKGKWTVILNSNHEQHLADEYRQEEDVARFVVQPIHLDKPVPRLRYSVVKSDSQHGYLVLEWEKIKIQLQLESKKDNS